MVWKGRALPSLLSFLRQAGRVAAALAGRLRRLPHRRVRPRLLGAALHADIHRPLRRGVISAVHALLSVVLRVLRLRPLVAWAGMRAVPAGLGGDRVLV